jgi:two-component system OmpR family sensor kinase
MLNPSTLRGRLTLWYAGALVVALVAFAALALFVLDDAQRLALDARLATTSRAVLALVDTGNTAIVLDRQDRNQFAAIVGAKANSTIFRANGTVAISSTHAIPPPISRRALASLAPSYDTEEVGGEELRVFTAPATRRGRRIGSVAVWHDADATAMLDRNLALAFAFAIPLLAALAVVAGGGIARRGLAPLDRIAALASEIEANDLSARLKLPPRGDELGRLAATFDRMLDRLQHAFERERRFTSDASHELRAPLSVIRAEADLALRRDRTATEYRAALETIASEGDALEALSRDLLTVARADASSATAPFATIDLNDVARDAVQRLDVLASERSVRIDVHAAANATVVADREGLERAVITVLHNAIKYASDSGTVEVRTTRTDELVELCVSDDGRGFSAEGLRRALDRFWRDDEARTLSGSGLGLAIAKATVEGFGGTIDIANGTAGGAVVRLRFPAQPR